MGYKTEYATCLKIQYTPLFFKYTELISRGVLHAFAYESVGCLNVYEIVKRLQLRLQRTPVGIVYTKL